MTEEEKQFLIGEALRVIAIKYDLKRIREGGTNDYLAEEIAERVQIFQMMTLDTNKTKCNSPKNN